MSTGARLEAGHQVMPGLQIRQAAHRRHGAPDGERRHQGRHRDHHANGPSPQHACSVSRRRAARNPIVAACGALPTGRGTRRLRPGRWRLARAGLAAAVAPGPVRCERDPCHRRRAGRLRGGMAGRTPRAGGDAARDAARSRHRRPQDRRPRRAGVQQLVPRRQARQRRRAHQRGDAPARLGGDGRRRGRARAGRRGAGRRPSGLLAGGGGTAGRRTTHHDRARRGHRRAGAGAGRGHDHRHRAADLGRLVAVDPGLRRRRAPGVLRRHQPDRARRLDRHGRGVPPVALGPQPARRRRGGGAGGRRRGRWRGRRRRRLRRRRRRGRLPQLPADQGRLRRVLRGAGHRRIGHHPRFR